MAPATENKKRKAVTRDVPGNDDLTFQDDFETGLLDGTLSDSGDSELAFEDEDEDESEEESELEGDLEDDDELDSDELPTDGEEDGLVPTKLTNGDASSNKELSSRITDIALHDDGLSSEDDSKPNYTVTEDANGNPRYVYKGIDPVYDSDDSDAPADANTIGNIPLSFYDSYPHIGYDINGKRIMRLAKGQALDSLLDSIEVPKGWTGLIDPATGKPLELSRDELEVLRKIQMNEVPEDGYDPYPVGHYHSLPP